MGFDINQPAETNRDRVRRLLLHPLGFRHERKTDAEAGQALLDGIADDLAYVSDDALGRILEAMRGKGLGAHKDFWPTRAAFIAYAETYHPRPLALSPKLMSWFASVEGPRALANGSLVETWEYFEKKKHPPHSPPLSPAVADSARRAIKHAAQDNARRLELIQSRRARGVANLPDDEAWEPWYLERLRVCTEAVNQARAGKAGV